MNETTLFVGRLTVIDFSYLHLTRGLLGESWIVDVELTGDLDDEGVIFDFSDAKKRIKSILDATVDHTLLVPNGSNQVSIEQGSDRLSLDFIYGDEKLHIDAPNSSFYLANVDDVSIDTIKPLLEKRLLDEMPKNVTSVKLHLNTEKIDTPFYHYSHGLKKHDGNCQRIAHGHRSKIDIFTSDKLDTDLVMHFAKIFTDSYVITKEDIKSEDKSSYFVSYKASQGKFHLSIPKTRCVLIENETTVEQIAHFIANESKKMRPNEAIRVRAYEGVEKGAISYRK